MDFKKDEIVISLIDNDEMREGERLKVIRQNDGYVEVRAKSGAILVANNNQIEQEEQA